MTKEKAIRLINEYLADGYTSLEWRECLRLCQRALVDGREENDTLRDAVAFYGKDTQIVVAVEEMSELIKELCKDKRGLAHPDDIAEEMADVSIVLKELLLIYDNQEAVEAWREKKIERLRRGTGK